MRCSCYGGSIDRRVASFGEARLGWLLLVLTFALISELQCLQLDGGTKATCEDYYSCNNSRHKNLTASCSCHPNCSLYDACCEDVRPSDWSALVLPQDSYECAVYPTLGTDSKGVFKISAASFIFLITKCPSTYGAPYIARLCAEPRSKKASTKEPPSEQWVTDSATGVTYSNQFCALCYGVPANRMNFWNVLKKCIDDPAVAKFGLSGCKTYPWSLSFTREFLPECTGPYFAACPNGSQQAMQEACKNNPARYYFRDFTTYRNYNCSLCAPSDESNSNCIRYSTNAAAAFDIDLKGMLGIDYCPKTVLSFATKDQQGKFAELCPDTVFDMENCSEAVNLTVLNTSYGPESSFEYHITPNGVRLLKNSSYTLCYRCQPKTVFNYTLQSDKVAQLPHNETYAKPLFQVEADGSLTICSELQPIELPSSTCSALPSDVSVVLMSLSLIGLVMYAVAYAVLPSLQNLPGQIVLHQSAAFFAAFLLWLLRAPARHSGEACTALGVLTHFFFIAAFTWTTVYAVEVVRALGFQAYGTAYTKRRLWYTVIGWLVPVVITVIAIAVDWAPSGSVDPSYRPAYGAPQCFINNPTPHRIFFTAPLAVLLLIDMAIYTHIVVRLVLISGQTRLVRENHHEKHVLAVKLVFALGITWIFAVLATATKNCYIAYIFSVLNSLQGVFVFVIFVCNARTCGQIYRKIRRPTAPTTGVATELTVSRENVSSSTPSVPPKRKKVLGVNSFSPVSLAMDARDHASELPPR